MLLASLFPVLAFLSGTIAVPLNSRSIEKRALPKLGGVNLAGCDFGMNTNGNSGTSYCPGTDQIAHFTKQGANLIRLPVGWQYLTANSQTSTSFDGAFFAKYDKLMQASLAAGAYVMVDVHNYARWNGGIIGQGGPSNADFANLWSNIAKRYAAEPRIIFGIMNEPHDLDMPKWGATVQAAVNAIRAAGATSQSIALPGTLYTHAEPWYQGVNDPVVAVTDPASSDKSKLIIDVHQYLDSDGSGTSRECVINAVDKMKLLSAWLKTNGRKAIVSEIGGGNTASCQTNLGQFLSYVASDSNFIGFAAWSAGSFDSSYELSITPQNGQDNDLFKKAILSYLPGAGVATSAPATTSTPVAVPSSTRAVSSSTRAAASSARSMTSTAIVTPATSSSKLTAAPSSSRAPAASSAAAAPASASANLQTYAGTLGGAAPAVTKSGNGYMSGARTYNFLGDALSGSCYDQMNVCQNAANKGGNKGALTVDACNTQIQACLKVATAA